MQLTSLSLALTRAGFLSFSPASLFAASEPGAWYDPGDMSTMFQDAAGTTPVTAVEQPVGLILDKSKGLVLGAELVTNGDFSNGTTGWTAYNAVISAVNGTLKVDDSSNLGANSSAVQQLNLVSGRTYLLTFDVVSVSGTWSIGFATSAAAAGITFPSAVAIKNTTGPQRFVFTYDGTRNFLFMEVDGAGIVFYDNISVRELPGNHATQTTATSRPVLSARYNLLTKTEQFDDAVWVKQNVTVTPNAAVAPDGTTTADRIYPTSTGSGRSLYQTVNAGNSLTVRAKAAGMSWLWFIDRAGGAGGAWFNLSTGAKGSVQVGHTSEIVPLGDGWYECSIQATTGVFVYTQIGVSDADNSLTATANGTNGVLLWGASLVPADQASLPYQRVNTATDYDADPSKFKPYLRFDGVDDWLVTPTITPGTDKAQVFAGVRKLSDATRGMVAETNTSNGAFQLNAPQAPATANYAFGSQGTATSALAVSSTPSYVAPTTNVLTGIGDISGDSSILRVNGTQAASNTADQGTGNYGNYPLYIGRRGGITLPFNGHLYGLIVRFGANLPAGTIASTETWLNQKTGAY